MKPHKIALTSILTGLLAFGQQPPAPAKRPAAAAPAAPSPVDNVIKLLKSKMSEALIMRSLQNQKPYNPSPAEMTRLKDAGASDNLIMAIMDPASAAAPAPTPAPAPPPPPPPPPMVETPAAAISCPAPAAVSVSAKALKRRLAVNAFDYSAVKTQVTGVMNNDVNIGQGIRAMLTVRMAQSNSAQLVEREKLDKLQTEIALGQTSGVRQGTKAKSGGLLGADAILLGDIVIFGRDDKSKGAKGGGCSVGGYWTNRLCGSISAFGKDEKAVVAINLRIVDTETGEILAATEARGESKRSSKSMGGFFAQTWRGGGGGQVDMTSSNFAETIIGEATQAAVDKIAVFVDEKMPSIAPKTRIIEGKVASVDGCIVTLAIGGNEGIQIGDHFEILKIISNIIDPDTKEILDVQTEKAGELIVSTVRDKIVVGQYGGAPISMTYPKGYVARKSQ